MGHPFANLLLLRRKQDGIDKLGLPFRSGSVSILVSRSQAVCRWLSSVGDAAIALMAATVWLMVL